MAKAKSFAEKMLKKLKPKDEFSVVRVIRPKVTDKGSIRYDSRTIRLSKNDDENKTLGL